MLRRLLPSVLLLGAAAFAAWMFWGTERPIALIPVTIGPRPPVHADPATRPIGLRGLADRFRATGNALRRERNDVAQRHAAAVAAWRAGEMPLREVENLEQLLWVARYKTGEISAREMHTQLATLFGREAQRQARLAEKGLAGEEDATLARLYAARERHLARTPAAEDDDRYETLRQKTLDDFERRHRTLVDSGMEKREGMELEWQALKKDFPPPAADEPNPLGSGAK